MARLIHLNGPPGIGKSTIARRYADERPGVLDCDVDVLRTLVGGWRESFGEAGALIRPAALALITTYLGSGRDVVLPQMLVRLGEVRRFEAAAAAAGAGFVELMLTDDRERAVSRFHRREGPGTAEWDEQVRAVVAAGGGDEMLRRCYDGLTEVLAHRPDAVVVSSVEGAVDETYQAVVRAVTRGNC